ncbi:NTP transferase domain-containing protein [Candidatus Micrarchaeota archaeon]|nr:NTP transferase domain-containing protein [Candidatus Micrarchaeota archaeon]
MKAVILVGGEGIRMRPFTFTRPKGMLYAGGKPLLYHLLKQVKGAGIKEAIIIVRSNKEKIIDYFSKKKNSPGLKISFVTQGKKTGTAAALLYVEKMLDCPFIVLAGDTYIETKDISSLIKAYHSYKDKCLLVKEAENPSRYGVVEKKKGKVFNIIEKPKKPKSTLVSLSSYVFDPCIFNELKKIKKSASGEYEITPVLKGARVVHLKGVWIDITYPWDLFRLNDYLLRRMKAKAGKIVNSTIKGKVIMEEGAEIINSYVDGNLYIGKNSRVGPFSYIRGSVSIGENCEIGDSATIKNSILFDNVKAKHLVYIGDSIIGDNVNFGAGTQIANYRFDSGKINVYTEKGWANSGTAKLGAFIGDNVKFGVLSCTMPGKIIEPDCWISSGVVVNKNIKRGSKLFIKQEIHIMKD